MNILNVDVLSEIMVTVGGERCAIDLGTTTDTVRGPMWHSAQAHVTLLCSTFFNPISLPKTSLQCPLVRLGRDKLHLMAWYDLVWDCNQSSIKFTYVCIYVFLLFSGIGSNGQVPVLYTWQYHICDKYCHTVPSHSCGMGCGRGWSQPNFPPGYKYGHHFGGFQKGICDEEAGGCSDDADEDTS